MKTLGALVLAAFAVVASSASSADAGKPAETPILVELFTSEGCSSCPPADELLRKMDANQPVRGAQLIVLSEHVDYWDQDGWKDQYSATWVTERQDAYCRSLRLEAYTPQTIVDGAAVLNLTNSKQMNQVFEKAVAAPKAKVSISRVRIDGGALYGHVQTESPAGKSGDVYVAVALDHAESQVRAGENQGRHLVHTAVVEYLKKLGKVKAGSAFDQDFQIKLKNRLDPANLRVVAFLQQPDEGKVFGAALQRPPIP